MPPETKVLLAAAPTQPLETPYGALFTDEATTGVAVSKERLYELAGLYSRLYRELVDAVTPALAYRLSVPPAVAAALAREALVPLTYFYLDRLMRLELLLTQQPDAAWTVAKAPSCGYPARAEVLENRAVTSPALNQKLLEHLAGLRGLEVVDCGLLPDPVAASAGFVNRNFDPSTTAQKFRRLALIAYRRVTNFKRPIPVLSLGYSTDAFKNEGFYPSYFTRISGRLQLDDAHVSPEEREKLRGLLAAVLEPLTRFLDAAKTTTLPPAAVFGSFVEFLAAAWPSSLFEGARGNFERAVKVLEPFKPRPLLVGERGDLESLLLITAAKTLGMEAIGVQHGGHSGYMADVAYTLEMELSHYSRFITNGWTRLPEYPPAPPIEAVPLPSPFLSERARRWKSVLRPAGSDKRYDFLLFSNGFHRFMPAPGGVVQSTTDYLRAFTAMHVDLAAQARRHGATILHKPRDPSAAAFLAGTFSEMERAGGEACRTHDRNDKGMTKELLDQCRIVLWDQLGMGFLECLSAGIPTMCYSTLPRLVEPHAVAVMAELEAVGVLHTKTGTLFAELDRAKKQGMEVWLAQPARAKACAAFSRSYGLSDGDWASRWTEYFASLSA